MSDVQLSSLLNPRSEYPRPDMDRSEFWQSLNGLWNFSADGVEAAQILVPFAWDTRASGICRSWLESAVYQRGVTIDSSWIGRRPILCFGAVHHSCRIIIDGEQVGTHIGGYESFELDLTGRLRPGVEHDLQVEVFAPADKRSIAHGKQRSIPRDDYDGVSFTPTSGIWQSVWLEGRGSAYVTAIRLRGDDLESIAVDAQLAGQWRAGQEVKIRLLETGEGLTTVADDRGRVQARLKPRHPHLWSPEDPYLYHVEFSTGEGDARDLVTATTGLREIRIEGRTILLNGRRIFLRGVLDQGYWPDSGLTAPTLDALERDLELAKNLGFTMVRKHLKFEDPLWLHRADAMGMLVWEEPACPSRFSEESARAFEGQLPAMVERDGNHPSIILWGLYNEEWGLDWDIPGSGVRRAAAMRAYDLLASLDSSRPIVENSGWNHVKTDVVDWHYYEPDIRTWSKSIPSLINDPDAAFPVRLGPDFVVDKRVIADGYESLLNRPNINSEYGEGWTSLERAWHLRWETQELRRHDGLSVYVYTELCDVEHEAAGILDAWRNPKEWGGCNPSDVHAETVLIVDLVPLRAGADIEPPTRGLPLYVRVSHHGPTSIRGVIRCGWSAFGASADQVRGQVVSALPVDAHPFKTTHPVRIEAPAREEPGRLHLWLESDEGCIIARAFLDAALVEPQNRRGARPGDSIAVPTPGWTESES